MFYGRIAPAQCAGIGAIASLPASISTPRDRWNHGPDHSTRTQICHQASLLKQVKEERVHLRYRTDPIQVFG